MNGEATEVVEAQNRNDTLFGGRDVSVFVDGKPETVRVNQLKLAQYEAAFLKVDDEFELVAFICGKQKPWVYSLAPDSYEDLVAVSQEVNAKGFFVYSARRQKQLVDRVNAMRPEMVRAAAEAATSSRSPMRPQRPSV
jgi:hypothetical protein